MQINQTTPCHNCSRSSVLFAEVVALLFILNRNKSNEDSLIYFTASVSRDQEKSLFLIRLVSFWNFQKHASIGQMDPSGIHELST